MAQRFLPATFRQELIGMVKVAGPMTCSSLLEQMIFMTAGIFTGHLGREQIDAMALGNTAVNLTGLSLVIGFNTASDTLFSQTNGSENKSKLGVLLQKAIIINLLLCLPCAGFFLNIGNVLTFMGQDPDIARAAGLYTSAAIPVLPLMCTQQILSKYLYCQGIVKPSLAILGAVNVVHVGLLYSLLYWLKLDLIGAAIAIEITFMNSVLLHILYLIVSKIYQSNWTGWSVECLADWKEYWTLGINGMLMTSLTWWAQELYVVLAGYLGTVPLAAHAIVIQMGTLLEMLNLGFSLAVGMRVGNLIGSGDHVTARTSLSAGLVILGVIGVFVDILLMALIHVLPIMFTNDSEVIVLVEQLIPLLAVLHIWNALMNVCTSALQGVGRQRFGAIMAFIIVYCLTFPLGVGLMFWTELKVFGIWIGRIADMFLRFVAFYIRLRTLNWDQEVELAKLRTGSQNQKQYNSINSQEYHKLCEEDVDEEMFDDDIKESVNNNLKNESRTILTSKLITERIVLLIIVVSITLTLVVVHFTLGDYQLSHVNVTSLEVLNTTTPYKLPNRL